MSSSWGHTIRPLTEHETQREAELREQHGERYYSCSAPRCVEPSAFQTTYQYVTGRAGRISYARKHVCPTHAEKFRAKYEPTEIPADTDSRHASEVAAAGITSGAGLIGRSA